MPQLFHADGVFLVDDGSTDGTGERVRAEFPTVHVIKADGTLYWAKGMRLAWESAIAERYDWDAYLWLNDDVMLKPDALDGLIDDIARCGSPDGVIVGTCSQDASEGQSSYGATDLRDVRYAPNGSPQRAVGWFNGNVVLVPRVAYEKIGAISGGYRHARADYDYAERLKAVGVPFFCSSRYVGVCERKQGRFNMSILRRLAMLWKPTSCNLHDLWHYRRRHWGLWRAITSCSHLFFNVLSGR